MGTQDPRTHLLEKLAKVNVCMLTTAERDGTLVTRPMGLQQAEDGGTLRVSNARHLDAPQWSPGGARVIEVAGPVSPNGNSVSLEEEMVRAAEVKSSHDRSLTIYRSGLDLLRSSLGRR